MTLNLMDHWEIEKMVRLYWITAKDTGHLEAFRFRENAEKKLEFYFKEKTFGFLF